MISTPPTPNSPMRPYAEWTMKNPPGAHSYTSEVVIADPGLPSSLLHGSDRSGEVPATGLLRCHRRAVGGVADHPDRRSREVGRDVLRHARPGGAKALLGDVADMRGDDDVVERP